ncbi:MAG: Hsp20/alpha crystallin family protein [Firmicutes bacterium]|nr:Hsp20/alpha crystallin family protein [Bacillota bacterium]
MLSLTTRNAYVPSFFDEMDRLFDRNFFGRSPFNAVNEMKPAAMKTDIREEDGLYLMTMDLPGFSKEDIRAELKDGYLTIHAEKKEEKEENNENGYVVRERYSGSCSRSFFVGEHVTEENVKAAFRDGVLSLSFPKEEEKLSENTTKLIDIA